jgi:alpha-galactosidase
MNIKLPVLLFIGLTIMIGCKSNEQVYVTKAVILTSKLNQEPRINGAKVFGVRPGNHILYTVAATGDRPMEFSAENLPSGVIFNPVEGRLTGKVKERGTYYIKLKVKNAIGEYERELRLVVGDEIALTPPMGCNTWGGLGPYVDEKGVRASAEAMVMSGLINHGYCYVNIDDGWQGKRGGKYNAIQPNEKFGDMHKLCDDLHAMGLKVGIYSTPWVTSYAGFVGGSSDSANGSWQPVMPPTKNWRHGKFRFENNDANQIAEWGFDYFKYDWRIDSVDFAEKMEVALCSTGRDIVLELSNTTPIAQADTFTRIGNMTRTAGDLVDVWDKTQLDAEKQKWALGIRDLWMEQKAWEKYNRPGHWNMPCPLRVGMLGGWDEKPLALTRLTQDEQYSHISLWCLWAAPIIIGAPLDKLDAFTLSLLTNDEVLEIDQDPLGQQARQIEVKQGEVLVKEMDDGSKAVGLFNTSSKEPIEIEVNWDKIGISGKQIVRDLWRQKNIGVFSKKFSAYVPSHGVVLVRIIPKESVTLKM